MPATPEPTDGTDRLHRLERVVRVLREREGDLRRRLNRAHHQLQEVSDQMAAAFTQIDVRTDAVVAAAEFRALTWNELDIEGAIGVAIDHLTARFGACNVSLWLASSRGEFAMAGYGYYDAPRALAEATISLIAEEVCPALGPECTAISLEDGEQLLCAPAPGGGVLAGRRVLICPLAHRGEVLGAVMLFRSQRNDWPPNSVEILGALSEAFAEQLDRIIRVTTRGPNRWPAMDSDDV